MSTCFRRWWWLGVTMASSVSVQAGDLSAPVIEPDLVFEEQGAQVAVEAEHFSGQDKTEVRRWYRTSLEETPGLKPDADPSHVAGASGGAYLEILPDTRRTHGEKLIVGENFSNEPGKMAILRYPVYFNTAGRYYVWARTHSTGSEDNGLHVGIDGTWPATGQRMQWTAKGHWKWNSKQRTEQTHGGERYELYIDVPSVGMHTIQFSMREDGFEFDKWLMTTDRAFAEPVSVGPPTRLRSGTLPAAYPLVATPAPTVPPVSTTAGAAIPVARSSRPVTPVRKEQPDGSGAVRITGELKTWHKVTLDLDGPYAHELDDAPNPFTDLRMTVLFRHESGRPAYLVPGYFAADGNAGNSSAAQGTIWRAHLSPDKPGTWHYRVGFGSGPSLAVSESASGKPIAPYHGKTGSFDVGPTDKRGRDFRAQGRLQYVGKHHLRFAESGRYFLKAGPDAPETMLGYVDFDGTYSTKPSVPLKTWTPHLGDWRPGDPSWAGGRGKGLIGALNYLATKGCNAFSFLTYNAGGDGQNVWPFVYHDDPLHNDCSKLDQWQVVFDHAQANGLYLHFKTQEQENDDNRLGKNPPGSVIDAALDGGDLGPERRLYYRELIARFGYALALNWNLGEENTQSPEQQRACAAYFYDTDPYRHNIVIHTFPNAQDSIYGELLGDQSRITGASLQNEWKQTHSRTMKWTRESAAAGKPWVVANDEQGSAGQGVPPDQGYQGFDRATIGYDLHDIRARTLWGNLMAGGAGVEYYFGYTLPENDLVCEDYRSRDRSWDYARIALAFFEQNDVPFWDMTCRDELVSGGADSAVAYCLARESEIYVVYLSPAADITLDLSGAAGQRFELAWYNPRTGGDLAAGSVRNVMPGPAVSLGAPPADPGEDWVAVLRAR